MTCDVWPYTIHLSLDELRKELQERQGCRVSGSIQSNKIAGNVHFALHAVDFFVLSQLFSSFGAIDPSHTVHHLSFGSTFPGETMLRAQVTRRILSVIPHVSNMPPCRPAQPSRRVHALPLTYQPFPPINSMRSTGTHGTAAAQSA